MSLAWTVVNALTWEVEDIIVSVASDLQEAIVKLLKLDVIAVHAGTFHIEEAKRVFMQFFKIKTFGLNMPSNWN